MKGQRVPVVRSTFSPGQVRERTARVVAVDRDPETPERPLHVLVPAGIVALAALLPTSRCPAPGLLELELGRLPG